MPVKKKRTVRFVSYGAVSVIRYAARLQTNATQWQHDVAYMHGLVYSIQDYWEYIPGHTMGSRLLASSRNLPIPLMAFRLGDVFHSTPHLPHIPLLHRIRPLIFSVGNVIDS